MDQDTGRVFEPKNGLATLVAAPPSASNHLFSTKCHQQHELYERIKIPEIVHFSKNRMSFNNDLLANKKISFSSTEIVSEN